MNTFVVRLEGVNLSNYIYDVTDLNTIRGGSLQLLDAAAGAEKEMKRLALSDVESISTGASAALLRCRSDLDGKTIAADFAREMHKRYPYATFVVDAIEESGDFIATRESVLAMNRWRQMQQPSVAIPEPAHPSAPGGPCAIDFVSPAITETSKGAQRVAVGASVSARRNFGRDQKRYFYQRAAAEIDEGTGTAKTLESDIQAVVDSDFVEDFDQLSSDTSRGNLHHKMAVLYFDGNRFGDIQKHLDSENLKHFDRSLKSRRSRLLATLLGTMRRSPSAWQNGKRYRIETLLWGGDELIWVVPAWVGWEVIEIFYAATSDWEFAPKGKPAQILTHAAGVVFCHHNAPIRRITALAHDLAEIAKELEKEQERLDDRYGRNLLAYEILESFDAIGTGLDSYRARRIPPTSTPDRLILRGGNLHTISQYFPALRVAFPRSKLFDIVRMQRVSDAVGSKKAVDSAFAAIDDSAKRAVLEISSERGFGPTGSQPKEASEIDPIVWVHLAELWDYLPTEVIA